MVVKNLSVDARAEIAEDLAQRTQRTPRKTPRHPGPLEN
jgi:hypothetical protein